MIELDGEGLRPAQVAAVARGREPVRLSAHAWARNEAARAQIEALLERGEPLYGASTGVGALRDRQITPSERERYQWSLLRSHAVTAGRALPGEVVRAGMVVRLNQLGAGGAGVAAGLVEAVVAAVNDGLTPVTRELGSLGTGDLGTLSEIALAMLGEGLVWRDGSPAPAPPPARQVELGLRDALGFISSNAVTIGHAALLAVDTRALHGALLAVAALSFEAIGADAVVLHERVQAARGAPGQTEVAATVRGLLAGAAGAGARCVGRRPVQDPYPFRVLPQVEGSCARALRALEEVLARELNAPAENALIEEGAAWPNGNFHAAELAVALDALRGTIAQSGTLVAARVSALLDPSVTELTPFLACDPGLESGLMIVEYVVHAAAAQARSLVLPMAAQSVWVSLGVESHASLAATAARHTTEVLALIRIAIACELVSAVRALRMAGRVPAGAGTRRLFDQAAGALDPDLRDRSLTADIEAAARVLDAWEG